MPCDSPLFPLDLVARLADGLNAAGAELAIAATCEVDGTLRLQPAFCLMRRDLRASLEQALADGERRIERWTARQRRVVVPFAEARAFANVNTFDELQGLGEPPR